VALHGDGYEAQRLPLDSIIAANVRALQATRSTAQRSRTSPALPAEGRHGEALEALIKEVHGEPATRSDASVAQLMRQAKQYAGALRCSTRD